MAWNPRMESQDCLPQKQRKTPKIAPKVITLLGRYTCIRAPLYLIDPYSPSTHPLPASIASLPQGVVPAAHPQRGPLCPPPLLLGHAALDPGGSRGGVPGAQQRHRFLAGGVLWRGRARGVLPQNVAQLQHGDSVGHRARYARARAVDDGALLGTIGP
eukprot:6450026-Pyramimonas_sp.AAC.1